MYKSWTWHACIGQKNGGWSRWTTSGFVLPPWYDSRLMIDQPFYLSSPQLPGQLRETACFELLQLESERREEEKGGRWGGTTHGRSWGRCGDERSSMEGAITTHSLGSAENLSLPQVSALLIPFLLDLLKWSFCLSSLCCSFCLFHVKFIIWVFCVW